jgi:prepilin-type N-terminal cleavage/methylation domain-containing protein
MRGVNLPLTRFRERDERGYTLVELLVVLLILVTVVGGIAGAFVSGMNQQSTLSRRTLQQTDARLALDRMRKDIFCSTGATTSLAPQPNGSNGFTLTLAESSTLCPSIVGAGQSSVQWCTIGYSGGTTRYQLFRSASGTCDSTGTLIADYLAVPAAGWPQNANTSPTPGSWSGNIWPTPPTCAAGAHPAVAIDFNINRDLSGHPTQGYELSDTGIARNGASC